MIARQAGRRRARRVSEDCVQAASAHAQWAPKAPHTPHSKELQISGSAHLLLLPLSGVGCAAQVFRRLPACRGYLRARRPRGKGWSARETRAHLPANRFALTRALFASDPPYYRPINLLSRRLPPFTHGILAARPTRDRRCVQKFQRRPHCKSPLCTRHYSTRYIFAVQDHIMLSNISAALMLVSRCRNMCVEDIYNTDY